MWFQFAAPSSTPADLARSPANAMFVAYFSALENAASAMTPLKSAARAQAEMIGFMSRRAQACLEIPARMSQCRNPQELLHEQMRFWDQAADQYAQTSQRLADAWGAAAAKQAENHIAVAVAPRLHDYIEFPQPKRVRPTAGLERVRARAFA